MKKEIAKTLKTRSFIIILIYLFIALFAPVLANEKPLYISYGGENFFPALSNMAYFKVNSPSGSRELKAEAVDWKNLEAGSKVFAPVCWSAGKTDLLNADYRSPFEEQYMRNAEGETVQMPLRFRHFLGTGKAGEDILAGIIYGSRSSLSTGIFAMLIALFIGAAVGSTAGYFGDYKIKFSAFTVLLIFLLLIPSWFYAFHINSKLIAEKFEKNFLLGMCTILISLFLFLLIISLPVLLEKFFEEKKIFKKKIFIPVDGLFSRLIEIFISLPRLVLILTIAAIVSPSIVAVILIIGLTSWTETARIIRAEAMKLRSADFVEASRSAGNSNIRTMTRHIIPNLIAPLSAVWFFGIASAILTESGLSFLGIGLPPGTVSWGNMMFSARENYTAWWLVVFPGLTLFILLYYLRQVASSNKKLKSRIKLLT
jgi:peptide/nickel transport system permease protein